MWQTGSSEGESVVDSDDEGDDSEEYSELDEDEEEGLSWDELEEEAKRYTLSPSFQNPPSLLDVVVGRLTRDIPCFAFYLQLDCCP